MIGQPIVLLALTVGVAAVSLPLCLVVFGALQYGRQDDKPGCGGLLLGCFATVVVGPSVAVTAFTLTLASQAMLGI